MKPTIQRWQPGTCECRVYELVNEDGTITPLTLEEAGLKIEEIYAQYPETTVHPDIWKADNKPTKFCDVHKDLKEGTEQRGVIKDEGNRVSFVLRSLLGFENFESDVSEVKGGVKVLKEDLIKWDESWAFTGEGKDRVLEVSLPGIALDLTKKSELSNLCGDQFGIGKIIIK